MADSDFDRIVKFLDQHGRLAGLDEYQRRCFLRALHHLVADIIMECQNQAWRDCKDLLRKNVLKVFDEMG